MAKSTGAALAPPDMIEQQPALEPKTFKPAEAKPSPAPKEAKSGQQVYDFLLSANPALAGPLRPAKDWLDKNTGASAQTFYDELVRQLGLEHGTVRRAGKFLHGPTFEPSDLVKPETDEEIKRLREQNAQLVEKNNQLTLQLAAQTRHYQRKDELDKLEQAKAALQLQEAVA